MSLSDPAPGAPVLPRDAAQAARARRVVTAVFFCFAIGLGLWAGAIPALMRQTGLGVTGLGLALTLHTAAYIAAMVGGGQLARHVAPRRLMSAALAAGLPCYALLFTAGSTAVLTLALVAVGASAGLLDLAMNAEGTQVESEFGRPVLLSMHAAASAGFALGAIAGSYIGTHAAPAWCTPGVLLFSLLTLWALHRLGPRPAAPPVTAGSPGAPRRGRVPLRRVARLGAVLGLTISAEVAAQVWSARFLEKQATELAAFAGAGAALFAGCQAAMRLAGDSLRHWLDDRRLVLASLLVTALGYALVASSAGFAQSVGGFALVGLGVACVVPCCFALIAADARGAASAALGQAALVAGAIRLPTPLLLGAVTAHASDAVAFSCIALGLGLAWWLMKGRAA